MYLVIHWLKGTREPEDSLLPPGLLTCRVAADPCIPGKGAERESGAGSEAAGEPAETSSGANPRAAEGCGGLVRRGCGELVMGGGRAKQGGTGQTQGLAGRKGKGLVTGRHGMGEPLRV